MQNDTRDNPRHRVDFDVYIRYRRGRPFQARAKEMSADGLLLETRSVSLPPRTIVDLQFFVADRCFDVQAMVMHGDRHGISVLFREPQELACRPRPTRSAA